MNYLFGQAKAAPPPPPAAPAAPVAPPVDPVAQNAHLEARMADLEGKINKLDGELDALKAKYKQQQKKDPRTLQQIQAKWTMRAEYMKQQQHAQAGMLSLGRMAAAIEQQQTMTATMSAMKGLVATAKEQQKSSEWDLDALEEIQDEVADVLHQNEEVMNTFLMGGSGPDQFEMDAGMQDFLADDSALGGAAELPAMGMPAGGGIPTAPVYPQQLPPMPQQWGLPPLPEPAAGGGGGGGARLPNMPNRS